MQALLALVLLAAPALSVDATSACAPREALERELARAPLQFIESGGDLVLRLSRTGDTFRVALLRRDGAIALERSLPTRECPEAVSAAAVILERFVRALAVAEGRAEPGGGTGRGAGQTRPPPQAPLAPGAGSPLDFGRADAPPPRPARPTALTSDASPAATTPSLDDAA